MKKPFIIALCCIVAAVAACKKKPVEPTPEPVPQPVEFSEKYVGNYLGNMVLAIQGTIDTVSISVPMLFPFDSIAMTITKGDADNTVNATVIIDNELYQTSGTATADKADFDVVHLILDKPDFNVTGDVQFVATPAESDSLNLSGSFAGTGTVNFLGETYPINATGTVNGKLGKQ